MKRLFALLAVLALLAGCNTIDGAGQGHLERRRRIENAAKKK